jgi:hypothetical protein
MTAAVDVLRAMLEAPEDTPLHVWRHAMTEALKVPLKEWPVNLWVVLRDGQPWDYAHSRASAFHEAKEQRKARPMHFWSVAPAKGTISIQVPA